MLTWLGSSIPAVLTYRLEAAQDEHGLEGNIVLDLENRAAGVCLAHYVPTEGSLLREGLSSTLTWLPHIIPEGRCYLSFPLLDLLRLESS